MRLKPFFLTCLGVSTVIALIPVAWPAVDLAVAAFFLQPDPPLLLAQSAWVAWVNEYTPDTFRAIALFLLALWILSLLVSAYRKRGMSLGFVGLSLLLGPGFATWAVKEHHLRARPFDVLQFGGDRLFTPALVQANQCIDNCAFVSGHVACGFFLASLMLIDARHRVGWLLAGLLAGLTIGLARMAVGAHWLSDVLWALPITLICSAFVWLALNWIYQSAGFSKIIDVMNTLRNLILLMRPHQWLKNVFVFAGLVFSQTWDNGALTLKVLGAFAAFCCASSLVYIFNDWRDRASDALHPVKCKRPLASGDLSLPPALFLAGLLLLGALGLAANNTLLLLLLAMYVLQNLAYSWRLKTVPVVDVFVIAAGFMLRLLAGTLAMGIPPSRWLLLTGLFMALFLGFSKRKAESFHDVQSQRAVMVHYTSTLLDTFMAVTMTAAITTYSLFASSPEATAQHGERLIYSIPIVIFALMRYTLKVHRGHGEDISRDLLRDPWILLSAALWLMIFLGRRI